MWYINGEFLFICTADSGLLCVAEVFFPCYLYVNRKSFCFPFSFSEKQYQAKKRVHLTLNGYLETLLLDNQSHSWLISVLAHFDAARMREMLWSSHCRQRPGNIRPVAKWLSQGIIGFMASHGIQRHQRRQETRGLGRKHMLYQLQTAKALGYQSTKPAIFFQYLLSLYLVSRCFYAKRNVPFFKLVAWGGGGGGGG